MQPPHEYYGIDVTATAGSKAHRMHTHREMYDMVRQNVGQLYDRAGDDRDEYHLLTPEGYVLVLVAEHELNNPEIAVVTQMHQHINYADDSRFVPTDRIEPPQ